MPIKNWLENDRPRERLVKLGAKSLSDSELLAIIIGFGTTGKSAIDIARDMLSEFGSFSNLAKTDVGQLKKFNGIGFAKAITIAAAFEISRRVSNYPFGAKKKVYSSEELADYYKQRLRDFRHEVFRVVLLDSANQIIREVEVSEGILNKTLVHPREVFRQAIIESAAAIILIHNHPSGNIMPSREDFLLTEQLVKSGNIIDIKVLDHLIIGKDSYYSFKNEGKI